MSKVVISVLYVFYVLYKFAISDYKCVIGDYKCFISVF